MEYEELVKRIEALEKQQREEQMLIWNLTCATKALSDVVMETAKVVASLGK